MDFIHKVLLGVIATTSVVVCVVSAAGHTGGYGVHLGSSRSGNSEECSGQCEINGMTFDGNSDFSLRNGCIEYSKCRCYCDGNWRCYDGVDLCNPDSNNKPTGGDCQECQVYGIYYASDSAFDYRRDCVEMTDCYCYCNGSWHCQVARNRCPDTQDRQISRSGNVRSSNRGSSLSSSRSSSTSSSSSSRSSSSSSFGTDSINSSERSRITQGLSSSSSSSTSLNNNRGAGVITRRNLGGCDRTCSVNGTQIQGNSYFKHTHGCYEYQACYCNCEGSWQCPASTGVNICDVQTSISRSGSGVFAGRRDDGCVSCDVHGTYYTPNTYFTHRNGCIEWTECQCNCDGSWQCLPQRASWVCENICRQCDVDGTSYDGNSQFTYEKDCFVYDPCYCQCNGSWNCPADNGRWVCTDRCLECDVNGRKYPGNSNFKVREDCWEWDPCICECDGSWRCPKENAKWVCTDRCLMCDVNGTRYQGNTNFQLQNGCYQYNCDCNCDGGWNCPANRTIDTCNQNATTGCFYCNVHGQRFEGKSFFSHQDGCIRYEDCTCRCDGSWDCPGERATDTCRQNATSGCYSCDVYGNRVEGYSRFQLIEDCWRYECECDCSGGWQCSNSRVTFMCGTQQDTLSGCRDCLVGGNRYASRNAFRISWGCIDYNCQCNCDGTWSCPANSASVSCAGDYFEQFNIQSISNVPSSWCKECVINGNTYPGNSQIEYHLNCVKHYVRCYCNGGYRSSTSVDKECLSMSRSRGSSTSSGQGRCRECILNGQTFASRSEFSIDVGCKTYRCQCTCSGLAECTPRGNLACGTAIIATGSIGRTAGTSVISNSRTSSGGGGSSTRVTEIQGRIVNGGGTVQESVNRGRGVTITTGRRPVVNERTVITDGMSRVNRGGTVSVSTTGGQGSPVVDRGRTSVSRGVILTTNTGRTNVNRGGGVFISSGRQTDGTVSSRTITSSSVESGGRSTINTGQDTRYPGRTCSECIVNNQRHAANSDFDYIRGCVRYRCTCECNGESTCKPSGFVNCQSGNVGLCRQCLVERRRYQPLRQFTFRKDCNTFSCLCECSGRAICIQTSIPNCRPESVIPETTCRECRVDGQFYPSNSIFNTQRDCLKYTCQCECDGTHRCTSPVNICTQPTVRPDPVCRECEIEGRRYRTNEPFTLTRGCWRQQCICSCDGQADCNTETAEYTCNDERTNTDCRPCNVNGVDYPWDSKFTKREGCMALKCHCFCNGEHYCVGSGRNVCNGQSSGGGTVVNVGQRGSTTDTTRVVISGRRQTGGSIQQPGSSSSRTVITTVETSNRGERRPTTVESSDRTTSISTSSVDTSSQERQDRTSVSTETVSAVDRRERTSVVNREESTSTSMQSGDRRTSSESRNENDRRDSVSTDSQRTRNRDRISRTQTTQREREREQRNCTTCRVEGNKIFNVDEEFHIDRRCKRYRCVCYCNGRYACQTDAPINICDEEGNVITEEISTSPRIESTTAPVDSSESDLTRTQTNDRTTNTRTVNTVETTSTYFEEFESRQGSSVTRRNGEDIRIGRCGPCMINARRYRGGTEFFYDEGCKRFRCQCRCGGSWICPRQQPDRLCDETDSSSRGSSQQTTTFYEYEVRQGQSEVMFGSEEVQAGTCGICVVNNKPYRGDREFYYNDACKRFRCRCSCDGSWYCPRQIPVWGCATTDIESTGGSSSSSSIQTSSSSSGSVETSRSISGSQSSSDSMRSQSSSEKVTESTSTNSRTLSTKNESSSEQMTESGNMGTSSGENTISSSQSNSESTFSRTNTAESFFYLHEEREGTTENSLTSSELQAGRCGVCVVNGVSYDGRTTFSYSDGCKGFTCTCNCDGSWICPSQQPRILCTDECQSCTVRGQTHAFNSRFTVDYDECRKYSCTCRCNGRYTCFAEDVINVCTGGNSGEEVNNQCTTCMVNGEERQPNTRFQYQEGCKRYICTCNCNGQHECSVENRCQDRCRECEINGTRYRPNARFQYIKDCYRYNCECRCDGSFNCPNSETEYVCDGGCQPCVVNNRRYRGDSQFQYDQGCYRYTCNCGCDGSYNCPSENTIKICDDRDNEGGRCRKCHVNGESYDPNTFFQYDEGCKRYDCNCLCDGTHVCPASRTDNICGGLEAPGSCTQCVVNGTVQQPNRDFYHTDGCNQYRCQCNCNGSWSCQFESVRPNCRDKVDRDDERNSRCQACLADGRRYPPKRRFQFERGCERFDCLCNCDGSFNCPADRTRNICGDNSNRCKNCDVRGTTYSGNSVFVLRERCLQYQCFCECNGQWSCPAEKAVDTCRTRDGD